MKRKLTPRRGATIERAAVLRKIRALRKKHLASGGFPGVAEKVCVTDFIAELIEFVSGRVERFTKRKGGL